MTWMRVGAVCAGLALARGCDSGKKDDATALGSAAPAPSEPVLADPAPAPAPTPSRTPTPTVESPAKPSWDEAASGDRATMTKAKDELKRRVASGTASERDQKLLRGLCRQLGDISCAY